MEVFLYKRSEQMKKFVYVVANMADRNNLIDFLVKTKSKYLTEVNYREDYVTLSNERWFFYNTYEADFLDIAPLDGYRFSQKAKMSLVKTEGYHKMRKRLSGLYKESRK